VITDLCILEPDPVTRELTVASIHPGIARAAIDGRRLAGAISVARRDD